MIRCIEHFRSRSSRWLATAALVVTVVVGCTGPEGEAGESGEPDRESDPDTRAAVLASARSVLDAINESDPGLLREVMMPNARIVSTAPGRSPAPTTVEEMAGMLADPPGDYTERMWDPRVEVESPVASVWAPYDFYRDGDLSHCGIDAFHLVRADGRWRVQGLVYSRLQPPDCETHPDGPPVQAQSRDEG